MWTSCSSLDLVSPLVLYVVYLLLWILGGQSTAEFFRIMRRQFTEGEWSHILAPPTSKQLQNFYRFWVSREFCSGIHSKFLSLSTPPPSRPVPQGEFHQGRRKWPQLWPPEIEFHSLPQLAPPGWGRCPPWGLREYCGPSISLDVLCGVSTGD